MKRTVVLLCLLLAAGCGSSTPVATEPSPSPSHVPRPTVSPTPPATGPHFETPDAAMTYLANAWNAGNLTNLKHVTDPSARELLLNMHREATNLRLDTCVKQERGDYECTFSHDFPTGYTHKSAVGHAGFLVGPALRPGWYMTVYEYCGG